MPTVRVEGLSKRFGDVPVLCRVSLTIPDQSLVTLLGPSGCGKSTFLRLVAGLEAADEGRIVVGERVVTDPADGVHVQPRERRLGMVFQSYALWPHMRVWDNVAHPLRARGVPSGQIRDRVQQALSLVRLEGLAGRFPGELSGGQQQRVALARALVAEPEVLLLDEPLSNLDAKLRAEMRYEIRELQRRCQLTTVYVTHDQEEAFVISDRVCLMNQGVIEQVGTAVELYEQPQSVFAAEFVGAALLLAGKVIARPGPGRARVLLEEAIEFMCRSETGTAVGDAVRVLVRPEEIRLRAEAVAGENAVTGKVAGVVYLGGVTEYHVGAGRLRLRVREMGPPRLQEGDAVVASVDPSRCLLLSG